MSQTLDTKPVLRYLAANLLMALGLFLSAGCDPEPRVRVTIVSPLEEHVMQNGNALHGIVQVTDSRGLPVDNAVVTVTVIDPAGNAVATLACSQRGGGTYASTPHDFPIGSSVGTWQLQATARVGEDSATANRPFAVEPSRAEQLQAKYGFWLDDFDFFNCHGSDSFIAHEVADPDEGHVVLEEHCSHMGSGDQIYIGVYWSQRTFPATEEDARGVALASLPPFFVVQNTASTRVTFQGRTTSTPTGGCPQGAVPAEHRVWQTIGTFHNAEEPRRQGIVEWVTFQCPDDERTFTLVTSATRNVRSMMTDELASLRDSFRCP